ncbi:ACHAETE-SCUTE TRANSCRIPTION FACTOR-RELATED [Salix purpurea]|uniref:ACHAETE-SCUTE TRANSCRIPTION FACTOR-RELATED n=1 Tax=Salix purpurea TaxID=77065 RepID=A0A9Q0T4G7_SALPP|nr:ACHAETE-SCUTE TRANSCRIPTION FACTOR-RELATED [Salix purpurea]
MNFPPSSTNDKNYLPLLCFQHLNGHLEEPISHEKNYSFRDYEAPGPFNHFPPSPPPNIRELDRSTSFTAYSGSGDPDMVKKLHHNASERDRRKKINSLYSSLRSLLPASDHMKKLSIPSTISRVLKYIPELQQQVEKQIQRKEELLSKLSGQEILLNLEENWTCSNKFFFLRVLWRQRLLPFTSSGHARELHIRVRDFE